MTDIHRTKSVIVGAIILLLVFSVAASIPTLRRNSTTFNWLFSPSDLYSRLAVSTIDLAKEGERYHVTFENRYPGLHWFAIQVEEPPAAGKAYEGEFILRLEVNSNGKPILSELVEGPGDPYLSREGGFVLHRYRVPGDLPLRETLNAEITIVKASETFESKHGLSELVVKKLSDE